MPTTEAFQLRSLIALAKWLHGEGDLEKPVVMELVRVQRGSKTLATKGSHAADEAAKWLDWPDYLRLVETLKLECAPLNHARRSTPGPRRRDGRAAYLLFAILACVPDRQSTLRELELGRTLVCEETDDGLEEERREEPTSATTGGPSSTPPRITRPAARTARDPRWCSTRGCTRRSRRGFSARTPTSRATLRVPSDPGAYGDWGHRAALAPNHRLVFTRPNGEPWTVSELSRTFSRAAMRLTGKKTNPHLVVTWSSRTCAGEAGARTPSSRR